MLSVPCGAGQLLASRVPVRWGWLPVAQGAAGTPCRAPPKRAARGVRADPSTSERVAGGHSYEVGVRGRRKRPFNFPILHAWRSAWLRRSSRPCAGTARGCTAAAGGTTTWSSPTGSSPLAKGWWAPISWPAGSRARMSCAAASITWSATAWAGRQRLRRHRSPSICKQPWLEGLPP